MKRFLLLQLLLTVCVVRAAAMSYDEARSRAWFLTDKMAYELNLTPEQYECAYEINLTYLMHVRTESDCFGAYYRYRDADLRCVLTKWQYDLYATLSYFTLPLRWLRGAWVFPIYNHYAVGTCYYAPPSIYHTFHGANWIRRSHHAPSPYKHRHFHSRPPKPSRPHVGHAPLPSRPAPGHSSGHHRHDNDKFRPDRGSSTRPDRGSSTRPDRGSSTRPDRGSSTRPDRGRNTRPDKGSSTRPDRGSSTRPDRGSSTRPSRSASRQTVQSSDRGGHARQASTTTSRSASSRSFGNSRNH